MKFQRHCTPGSSQPFFTLAADILSRLAAAPCFVRTGVKFFIFGKGSLRLSR